LVPLEEKIEEKRGCMDHWYKNCKDLLMTFTLKKSDYNIALKKVIEGAKEVK
jgi:hypothetical protein